MPRLTSPTGITVNVSDEKAAQLASVGYTAEAKAEKSDDKPAAKKVAAKKSDSE